MGFVEIAVWQYASQMHTHWGERHILVEKWLYPNLVPVDLAIDKCCLLTVSVGLTCLTGDPDVDAHFLCHV